MKKFTYIANVRLPTEKAHGIAIMKMCEAFAKQGIEVELVIPKRKNNIKNDPFQYYGVERGFKITHLWCLDLVSLGRFGFWIESITFVERVIWHVLFKKDIFYTRDEFIAFYLKMFSKRVFWEAHTAKNLFWTFLLKGVNGLIAISVGLKYYYVSAGFQPHKIMVAHSGVDLSKFNIDKSKAELRSELSLPLDKKIVAYIGKRQTMGESKGVEEIEEAFKHLSKDYSNTHLLIVSNEPFSQVPLYMKAVDILVMNYPNTEHYAKYMSPLKLFEYMASGTPIVAPNLPSIREVLDDTLAYFFKSDNKEDFITVIKNALNDEKMAQNKAKKALEKVRSYTWDNRIKSILEFIK